MATHSSILAWRIPWTEEPDGLQSRGLQRVGHDCATNTSVKVNHRDCGDTFHRITWYLSFKGGPERKGDSGQCVKEIPAAVTNIPLHTHSSAEVLVNWQQSP